MESPNPQIQVSLQDEKASDQFPMKAWVKDIFEPLIDSIEVAVFVLDCSGAIKRVNRYFLEQYPWSMPDLISKNIFELMPDLNDMGVKKSD